VRRSGRSRASLRSTSCRKEEERQRPAQGDDEQRRRDVAERDVLEHVGREQGRLADLVEGRDERERRHGDAEAKERRAIPTYAAAPPQP
jgi:hypothetical protein